MKGDREPIDPWDWVMATIWLVATLTLLSPWIVETLRSAVGG